LMPVAVTIPTPLAIRSISVAFIDFIMVSVYQSCYSRQPSVAAAYGVQIAAYCSYIFYVISVLSKWSTVRVWPMAMRGHVDEMELQGRCWTGRRRVTLRL
jgi:hypothetical protein